MSNIDIKGIDKVRLLEELWNHQNIAGFFTNIPQMAPSFNTQDAEIAVRSYIDYFSGRGIKCDLSGDVANPRLYDRIAGEGTFMKVVQSFRSV